MVQERTRFIHTTQARGPRNGIPGSPMNLLGIGFQRPLRKGRPHGGVCVAKMASSMRATAKHGKDHQGWQKPPGIDHQ